MEMLISVRNKGRAGEAKRWDSQTTEMVVSDAYFSLPLSLSLSLSLQISFSQGLCFPLSLSLSFSPGK